VTTDRNLYKEGDTVSVKGYLRRLDMMAIGTVPDAQIVSTARFSGCATTPSRLEVVEAAVNEFGAYVATFHVPDVVSYGVNTAQFWTSNRSRRRQTASLIWQNGGSSGGQRASQHVADPRIPTGVLEITLGRGGVQAKDQDRHLSSS
jgi:hypothetical protein